MRHEKKRSLLFIGAVLLVCAGLLTWRKYPLLKSWIRPAPPTTNVPHRTLPSPIIPKDVPRVALVIDDVAYSMATMDHFTSLRIPLTFAILPRHKLAKGLADKAMAHHFAVMLHLPMEPHDVVHNDPGPSALYLRMTDQELRSQFDKDFQSVPHVVGINNHMGSAFTENEPKMKLVLSWVKERNVYFLDSYTSSKSVVVRAAKQMGVPCLRNETFLDNEDSLEGIEKQLDTVMKLALERKQTVAIGHYRRKYLAEALAKKIPEFNARGIEFVTLPALYHR